MASVPSTTGRRAHGDSVGKVGTASTSKRKQCFPWIGLLEISAEQQLCSQEGRGHAVPSVAERKQMARVEPVLTDIRKAVGGLGEQSSPRVVGPLAGKGRKNLRDVFKQFCLPLRQLFLDAHAPVVRDICSANEKSAVAGPTCVVIWTIGVPQHHRRCRQSAAERG